MADSHRASRGPYPVGVLETTISSPNDPLDPARELPCEIWYPAAAEAAERFDAPHPLGLPHPATPDLPPARTRHPLIVFSHGNSGLRQQSTFLTTHLASLGFVVAAPDHVGNTFSEMLALESDDERREVHLNARAQRPQDLASVIGALLDEHRGAQRLPPLDAQRVGVLGHSYGGWTSLKMPGLDRRVRSVCGLAPASEPFVGRRAFGTNELPLSASVACLVIAAEDDVLVDLSTSIEPLYARLGEHARLELLDRADHFHFCDGIELLHKMHENTPRENQLRPTRAMASLRSETETHAWLTDRVGRFFGETLEVE